MSSAELPSFRDVFRRVIYRRFTGIEFSLVHAQPPSLFIIHKRERLSPEEGELELTPKYHPNLSMELVRPLEAYFIMNNRIYRSPDVYDVLSNRLVHPHTHIPGHIDLFSFSLLLYTLCSLRWIYCASTDPTTPRARDLFGRSQKQRLILTRNGVQRNRQLWQVRARR